MATTICTTITNKSRNSYNILISRDKNYKIRGGETITLKYDLWSYLNKYSRKEIEKDIAKGILEVNTRIFTGDSNMTIDSEGKMTVASGGIDKLEAKDLVIAKPQLPPVSIKPAESEGTAGVVTARSQKELENRLGAQVVDYTDNDEKIAEEARMGFTKVAPPQVSNLFAKKANVEQVNTNSVFNGDPSGAGAVTKTAEPVKEAVKEVAKEEPKAVKEEPKATEAPKAEPVKEEPKAVKEADTGEMTEEMAKAKGEEFYINWLYAYETAGKRYTKILNYLTEKYPNVTFTKSNIKHYTSYSELKEGIGF